MGYNGTMGMNAIGTPTATAAASGTGTARTLSNINQKA